MPSSDESDSQAKPAYISHGRRDEGPKRRNPTVEIRSLQPCNLCGTSGLRICLLTGGLLRSPWYKLCGLQGFPEIRGTFRRSA